MSMDDPGWEGGLAPPAPASPKSGGGPNRTRLLQIGGSAVVVVVVIVAVLLVGGHKKSPSATTTTARGSTTSSTSGSAGTGNDTPVIGVSVAANGQPVTHSGGTQVTITDASGKNIALTGVKVESVQTAVSVGGKNKPTPASIIPLKPGDYIWGIGEINSSSYTQVTSAAVLTTFLKNYSVSGHTDNVYLYFYDPAANQDYDTNPPQISFVETSQSLATLDCSSPAGC